MSSPRFEAFLARLYSDRAFLEHFLSEPDAAMLVANLDSRERGAATLIDRAGLLMAARSYELKRQKRRAGPRAVVAMFWRLARAAAALRRRTRTFRALARACSAIQPRGATGRDA